jgi:small-conductance mechanosensitive channel
MPRAARDSDACLWHVSIAGGAGRRGCVAAGVPGFFNGPLGTFDEFWNDNRDWLVALLVMAVAFLLAYLVDRAFQRRAEKLASSLVRGDVSRETATRLRFVRRFIYAVILLIGLALALSQFSGVNQIAASILASGVVAAAIIGFAARQTLANFVAGVMLAITQPIRVGDWVEFEDEYGVVEDVRLNYTILRAAGEQRVLIPNEKLASGVMRNDTLKVDAVGLEVDVWIPPGADAARAVELLSEEGDVAVAETVPWGVRLTVGGGTVRPSERGPGEAALRARCHARLREEGLLEGFVGPDRS